MITVSFRASSFGSSPRPGFLDTLTIFPSGFGGIFEKQLTCCLHTEMKLHTPTIHQSSHCVQVMQWPASTISNRKVIACAMPQLLKSQCSHRCNKHLVAECLGAVINESPITPFTAFHLASGERYACLPSEICQCSRVIRVQWLFKPS